MKLVFGKWTKHELQAIQQDFEAALTSMPYYKGTVLIPYNQEPPTIVELPRKIRRKQFWISSHAHKVH